MIQDTLLNVSTNDGKYTIIQHKDGSVEALRYGEKWRDCTGDKLILTLAQDLQAMKETVVKDETVLIRKKH
jgi:hypothetical protein